MDCIATASAPNFPLQESLVRGMPFCVRTSVIWTSAYLTIVSFAPPCVKRFREENGNKVRGAKAGKGCTGCAAFGYFQASGGWPVLPRLMDLRPGPLFPEKPLTLLDALLYSPTFDGSKT
jgi:hypothetical protein